MGPEPGTLGEKGCSPEESRKLKQFLHQFERFRQFKGRVPVADLLSDLLEQSGYIHVIGGRLPGGDRPRANLEKFLQLLRQWKDVDANSLKSILDKVDRLTELKNRETEAPVEAEEEKQCQTDEYSSVQRTGVPVA